MLMRIKKLSFGLLLAVGAAGLAFVQAARATDLPPGPEAPGAVKQVKVLPDKAPDCSSLKSIAETVTRGCKTNDAKAIAIYNFMLLTHYHGVEPSEDGGVPALKDINCYGWATCGATHIVESALWRELGWGWRFVVWPGHTTTEAIYDDRRHYFDAFLKSFLSTENVNYAGKALVPAAAGKPAAVVLRVASFYIMVKASGEAAAADKVAVSVDGGKSFKVVELQDFGAAVQDGSACP